MVNPISSFGGDDGEVKVDKNGNCDQARGINFANLAYNYQKDGFHIEAIECYTKAISLVPNDHRYYVNRSASYEDIGRYLDALSDAEKSIELDVTKPKGHFRKGRCLRLLKRFKEAEECFKRVLEMKPECEDTLRELELINLQVSHGEQVEKGFSNWSPDSHQSEIQISKKNSRHANRIINRSKDHDLVSSTSSTRIRDSSESSLTGSDRSMRIAEEKFRKEFNTDQIRFESKYGPESGPTNLLGYHGVYVGHIDPDADVEDIRRIFSKHGHIVNLKFLPEKFCAFVSYNNPTSPRLAIQHLSDRELPRICVKGRTLKLNFHVSHDQDPKLDWMPVEAARFRSVNNECYAWRTTGCNDEQCKLRHLKSCRGIDYQTWMSGSKTRKITRNSPFTISSPRKQ